MILYSVLRFMIIRCWKVKVGNFKDKSLKSIFLDIEFVLSTIYKTISIQKST